MVIVTRRLLHHLQVSNNKLRTSLLTTSWIPKQQHRHIITTTTSNPFFSWNTLLRSSFEFRDPTTTVSLFKHMFYMGGRPNAVTFSITIRALSQLGQLLTLSCMHSSLLRLGFLPENALAMNTLTNSYANLGSVDLARKLFDEMPQRDLISSTVVMNAYVRCNRSRDAMGLFRRMIQEGVRPDGRALVVGFSASARVGDVEFGKSLEGFAVKTGVHFNVHVTNSLIDMYAKCGKMEEALELFESAGEKNVISWNSIVTGYAKSRNMVAARAFFDRIPERDAVSWSALINGYVQNSEFKEALDAFHEMRAAGAETNNAALTGALMACAQLGALSAGRQIHASLDEEKLRLGVVLTTSLVDMYAKCGCLGTAMSLFDQMEERTLVSWNVMINGLAAHGEAHACFELFSKLHRDQGLRPNSETFTGLLSACAHAGWLKEGKECFNMMSSIYGIAPRIEHCTCMVQLIGQSGHLDEAVEFIVSSKLTLDVVIWGALLSACNASGKVKMGEFAAEQILQLDPSHSGAYVQLASIYAKANMWKEVVNVRRRMWERGAKSRPGWSLFELDGTIHQFHSGWNSHKNIDEILSVLNSMDRWIQGNDLLH